MNRVTSIDQQPIQRQNEPTHRGYLFPIKRGLQWCGVALLILVLLGVSFQTIATQIDNRTYSPRGQLYTVNGRQMHIICQGKSTESSPTVILQAGGANESLWWYWVQNQLAQQVRVCAYDRAGLGWSEPANTARDPVTIVGELHSLLEAAGVQPPYVMAGHSYGAILTRIYAAQYPDQVAGIALVDGMPLELKDLSKADFDSYRWTFYAAQTPLWVMYRLGVGRFFVARSIEAMGYPPEIAAELAGYTLRNQTCDTDIAEKGYAGMWALMQASLAAEKLGNLPMAVLWASESGTNQASYAALSRAMIKY